MAHQRKSKFTKGDPKQVFQARDQKPRFQNFNLRRKADHNFCIENHLSQLKYILISQTDWSEVVVHLLKNKTLKFIFMTKSLF